MLVAIPPQPKHFLYDADDDDDDEDEDDEEEDLLEDADDDDDDDADEDDEEDLLDDADDDDDDEEEEWGNDDLPLPGAWCCPCSRRLFADGEEGGEWGGDARVEAQEAEEDDCPLSTEFFLILKI